MSRESETHAIEIIRRTQACSPAYTAAPQTDTAKPASAREKRSILFAGNSLIHRAAGRRRITVERVARDVLALLRFLALASATKGDNGRGPARYE